jgi:transcriptional regulator with XRE-family HTH domain
MRIRTLVGRRVREYRQRKGITQRALADTLGRQEETISAIERGMNLPSEDTLIGLSDVLGVPVHAFFETADIKSDDLEREEAIGRALSIIRTLSRRDLEIALRQLEAFVPKEP